MSTLLWNCFPELHGPYIFRKNSPVKPSHTEQACIASNLHVGCMKITLTSSPCKSALTKPIEMKYALVHSLTCLLSCDIKFIAVTFVVFLEKIPPFFMFRDKKGAAQSKV